METIKNIAAILGAILSLSAVITLCSNPIKASLAKSLEKYKKEQEAQNHNESVQKSLVRLETKIDEINAKTEATVTYTIESCRGEIKDIFYKYLAEKSLPLYEYKHLLKLEDIYIGKFHKNHYTKGLIDEMKKWSIDYTGVRSEDVE